MAQLVILALKGSVIAMVFALGLGVTPRDLVGLLRQPGLLSRSLVSMFAVMLVAAVAVATVAHLHAPVEIVIVLLALAPIPPLLPRKQAKAGGETSYIYGLIVVASVLSMVWIPIAMAILGRVLGLPLSASVAGIASIVITMILAPLAGGVAVGWYAPAFANRVQATLSRIATLVLFAGLALIIAKTWRPMVDEIGDGTLLALAGFVLIGLVSGHLLGGPDNSDRSVLAMASACRHPGIALSLASLNFPQEKAVTATLLLYLLVSAILTAPYVAWRRRAVAGPAAQS